MDPIKPIPGHSNYGVTRTGKVWSYLSQRFIKSHISGKCKYPRVRLGRKADVTVHRLVAMTWLNLPQDKQFVVNHISGRKLDFNLNNLEVTSQSGNLKHYHSNKYSAEYLARIVPREVLLDALKIIDKDEIDDNF